MKKSIVILILFSLPLVKTHATGPLNEADILKQEIKTDTLSSDSLAYYLQSINVTNYYGGSVNSFMSAIPNTPASMFVSSCRMGRVSMYKACYLQVTYYPDLVLRIYVNEFTHLAQYNPALNWDVSLFKQEKVYRISVFKDNKCINGICKNP